MPKDYREALRSLVDLELLNSRRYEEQQNRAVRKGAHPKILLFERLFIRRLARMGIPFFAHNMVRTHAEQEDLFNRKVSQRRGGESPHNWGCAVDIVHCRYAWNISSAEWRLIGHIGREVAQANGLHMRWGGDWDGDGKPVLDDEDENFWDPAHWELFDWQEYHFPFSPPLDHTVSGIKKAIKALR